MSEIREIEREISKTMLLLGIPASLKGYELIRRSVARTVQNPKLATSVTKLIYLDLAKELKTTDVKIERAIRNAIEISWQRGETKLQDELFGYSRLDNPVRPTNSEFIAVFADAIRMRFR